MLFKKNRRCRCAAVHEHHARLTCFWLCVEAQKLYERSTISHKFEGWDEWLPGHLGKPEHSLGAYHVGDVRAVIAFLRTLATREKVSGVWNEIRVLLSASD